MRKALTADSRIDMLSDRLANYLRTTDESGSSLAKRVGIHPSQVSRLLRKSPKTLNRSVQRICDAVGLRIPNENLSTDQESRAALGEAIGKITKDDAKKTDKLAKILQLIASLSEEE
jgi:hypothetical protein